MPKRALADPYGTAPQQREAALMGMHVFLGSEIMLFGGLFAVASVLRLLHPRDVVEASKHLHLWIGGLNTAVLLTSSALVAFAIQAARNGKRRPTALLFGSAALLGLTFLSIKSFEYATEYTAGMLPGFGEATHFATPATQLFMNFYLVSTALHALHVGIGVLILSVVATAAGRGWLALPRRVIIVENAGLYWHLVDAIWVFLYPVLYLAR